MNDPTPRPEPQPPRAAPRVVRRRNWLPSLIWLIPIVAAVVGVALVARILMDRGPEIVLTFKSAEGLEANKTVVRYKDVQIGTVTHIRLATDRSHVRVLVQLKKEASAFTAQDTRFWVVRPRLDTSGISGLGTLLSGAYIGVDAGTSEETSGEFTGLEAPPIVTRDDSGRQFLLRAHDVGSLDIGSPVYFRRIKVGQVAAYELDPDGRGVTLRVFVNSPYEKFVGVNTRFWHASGFDVDLNASGLKVRTQSLVTVLIGGIAFQAPDDQSGPVAAENAAFVLASDETAAMKEPDGLSQTMLLYFNQSLRGLSPGAAVDFRGVVIGEVKSIGVEFDRGERAFRMPVVIQVYPDRLRRRSATEPDILALRGLPGPLEDCGRIIVDEVERGVRQGERRALVVRHNEYGSVERRLVAPPALPFVVAPRAALWAELVAAHYLGADVAGEVPREVVVEAATPAGVGAVGPARRGAGPRKHVTGVGVTERTLEALVLTRAETVPRDVEILDSEQLNHAFLLGRRRIMIGPRGAA